MGTFHWASAGRIPPNLDLRAQGWHLADPAKRVTDCVSIVHAEALGMSDWARLLGGTSRDERRLMLVATVDVPSGRAKLLHEGFGEVVCTEIDLPELSARAARLATFERWVPQCRAVAGMELDLLAREATFGGRALNLHPREFAILWRLSDRPGEVVSKEALLRDVWRLSTSPESNSIAVQLSRLRRKLTAAGLDGAVLTTAGGYCLRREYQVAC